MSAWGYLDRILNPLRRSPTATWGRGTPLNLRLHANAIDLRAIFADSARRVRHRFTAHQATLGVVRAGTPYDVAVVGSREVLVDELYDLGALPHPALPHPAPAHLSDSEAARRWSLHGVGNLLDIDVHDAGVVADEDFGDTCETGTASLPNRASTFRRTTSGRPCTCAVPASVSKTTPW